MVKLVGINHVALEVGDVDEALELSTSSLDPLAPRPPPPWPGVLPNPLPIGRSGATMRHTWR